MREGGFFVHVETADRPPAPRRAGAQGLGFSAKFWIQNYGPGHRHRACERRRQTTGIARCWGGHASWSLSDEGVAQVARWPSTDTLEVKRFDGRCMLQRGGWLLASKVF